MYQNISKFQIFIFKKDILLKSNARKEFLVLFTPCTTIFNVYILGARALETLLKLITQSFM